MSIIIIFGGFRKIGEDSIPKPITPLVHLNEVGIEIEEQA
jgi:hypothetical protein